MTLQQQDSEFADLYRERKTLKANRADIEQQLQPYPDLFSRLSSELVHDRSSALTTLRTLDVAHCAALLGQWFSVSSRLADNGKAIIEKGGEVD
jgi:hypothetical protein